MARYIDADALRNEWLYADNHSGYCPNDVIDSIDYEPTADVAPVVHGRWVESQRGFLICSNCNADRLGIPLAWYMPYCYHCGAKMDLEVEK